MTKNFTQLTTSFFLKLMFVLTFIFTSVNINAAIGDIHELGELELNKEYSITNFEGYKAKFTPEKSGILVWESVTATFITVYNDEEYTEEQHYEHSYISGGQVHEYKVEAGRTYYCYSDFVMNGGTFKLYFIEELKRVKTVPEENTEFDITGDGFITLNYNLCVEVDTVKMAVNGQVVDEGRATGSGRIVGIQLKGENDYELDLKGLVNSGVLKEGDELVFTFKVASKLEPTLLLEETVTYICPKKPTTLVSHNAEGFVFKSYWSPNDEAGKLILTFDANLWIPTPDKQGPEVTISFGNPESEDPGEFYNEKFYPTVDGNKLICDFTNKRRRVEEMIVSDKTYEDILIKVDNVRDENGNAVASDGKGTIGSWSWRVAYKQIDCDYTVEFSPKNKFHSDETTIELWIGGYYQNVCNPDDANVQFVWTDKNGMANTKTFTVTELGLQEDEDGDPGDAIVYILVPEEVRDSEGFKVSLVDCVWIDGLEHEVFADYIYINQPKNVGIDDVSANSVQSIKYYDTNGVEQQSLNKGINIVKKVLTNGSVETTKIIQ